MRTYIFGTSQLAEIINQYLNENNTNVGGYIVDEKYIGDVSLSPIISWEEFVNNVSPVDCEIIVAIGYNSMNETRKVIFDKIKFAGYKIASFIHPSAVVSPTVKMGEGNIVLENVTIQPYVNIGNSNIFWSNVNICHHTDVGSFNFFAASTAVLGKVKIGDNCFFGCNSTIKNRVVISNKTFIGAGAYCSFNTDKEDVIVPTKSIKLDKKSTDMKL